MVFLDAVINTRLFTEDAFSQAFPSVGFTVHLRRFRYPAQRLFYTDIYFLCLLLPELTDNIFQQFYFLMPGTKGIADRQGHLKVEPVFDFLTDGFTGHVLPFVQLLQPLINGRSVFRT